MGKFSNYRYLELKDETSAPVTPRTRALKQPRRMKKVFIGLIILALFATYFLGLFAGQSHWLDSIAKSLGYQNVYHHAVIIDAGSSGSRVLAYRFRVPFTLFSSSKLDLEDEFFEQSKPGLSSYADDPAKGADTIVQLIKKAEFLIPLEKRKSTPLLVRATAGLRLLPAEKARLLIENVQSAIMKLGYDVSDNAVEIMDGADEGIFIWYTVNLLHKIMEGETMAALDLGGGSTQITYQVAPEDDVPQAQKYLVPAGQNNITVFTHSYLGLGLNAARLGVLRLEADDPTATRFSSVCVEPIVQNEKWVYDNTEFVVSGAPRPAGQKRSLSFSNCRALVRRYVLSKLDWAPARAPRTPVAAMSYFYDVAADAGIIDVMRGGAVSISSYRNAALRACSAANVEQPWACSDLVFIVSLLQDAYKIADEDPISLYKKVDGHEVSWALGLAYTTIVKRTQEAHEHENMSILSATMLNLRSARVSGAFAFLRIDDGSQVCTGEGKLIVPPREWSRVAASRHWGGGRLILAILGSLPPSH